MQREHPALMQCLGCKMSGVCLQKVLLHVLLLLTGQWLISVYDRAQRVGKRPTQILLSTAVLREVFRNLWVTSVCGPAKPLIWAEARPAD